jgi:hypothetical protein
VVAGLRGLTRASLEVRDIRLTGPIESPRLSLRQVAASGIDFALSPDPTGKPDYTVSLALKDVRLDAADGRALPALALVGSATLADLGASLGIDPRGAVRRWAKTGGKLRLDRLAVTAGTLVAVGTGELAIAADGQLSGKIVVRFSNLEELPKILDAFQPGSRTAAAAARVLLAVTRKVQTDAGPARETVLHLGGGFLSVGIVPIATLPRVPL